MPTIFNEKCTRCGSRVMEGLPESEWDKGGFRFRFKGKVSRTVWNIRFNYLKLRGLRDAPTAMDMVESKSYTDVELCDGCWGDVLNFICTTKPDKEK